MSTPGEAFELGDPDPEEIPIGAIDTSWFVAEPIDLTQFTEVEPGTFFLPDEWPIMHYGLEELFESEPAESG